jgi:hypothetical protein
VVGQGALGDGGEKGARLVDGDRLLTRQQAQEHIVRQVGGPVRTAEFIAQPALQPSMMVAVKVVDLLLQKRRRGNGHEKNPGQVPCTDKCE